MKTVLFQRQFLRFQGGHLKVWQYFNHVRAIPGFRALVRFSPDTAWSAANPWLPVRDEAVAWEAPPHADVLFVAGRDWRWLDPRRVTDPAVPVINLLQHVLHGSAEDPLERRRFLANRAIRICTSAVIAEAIAATGEVRGPVFTIPNGIDMAEMDAVPRPPRRDIDMLIVAAKQPALGRRLAERLARPGRRLVTVRHYEARPALLEQIARARVTLFLPNPREGFYIPALEGMALGTLVVCPDCEGNRAFCADGQNCAMPPYDERSLADATERTLDAGAAAAGLCTAARATAEAHGLEREREAFAQILTRAHQLWADID